MDFNKNFGNGTDIETIKRFQKLDRTNDKIFLEKIFTKKEIDYCFSKDNVAQHLASRYSAKEAIIKALGNIEIHGVDYKKLEIFKSKEGVPKVRNKEIDASIKISMSHCKDKAIAFAIAIRK